MKLEIRDLWCAAYLIFRGARLKEFTRDPLKLNRYNFLVESDHLDLEAEAGTFFRGEGGYLGFKMTVLDLKGKLYQEQNLNRVEKRS